MSENNNENGRQTVKSYSKAWKIEQRIYAIGNLKMPRPLAPRLIGYFALVLLFIFVISQILPFFKVIPPVLRYAALPIVLTIYIDKKKIDGKNPLKYYLKLIVYGFRRGSYVERFGRKPRKPRKIKANWWCSYVRSEKPD